MSKTAAKIERVESSNTSIFFILTSSGHRRRRRDLCKPAAKDERIEFINPSIFYVLTRETKPSRAKAGSSEQNGKLDNDLFCCNRSRWNVVAQRIIPPERCCCSRCNTNAKCTKQHERREIGNIITAFYTNRSELFGI